MVLLQVNRISLWQFKDREGLDDSRVIVEPELICESNVNAGVTDLCFLDEQHILASLENGEVVMLQYRSSQVNFLSLYQYRVYISIYPLPNSAFLEGGAVLGRSSPLAVW